MGRSSFWPELGRLVYGLIRHGRYSTERISNETGISASTINRNAYSFMDTPSALPISLGNTILIMQCQNDFRVHKHISNYLGFLLARLPRAARNRKSTTDKINELQDLQVKAIRSLLEYQRMPLAPNRDSVIQTLLRCMEYETSVVRDLKFNFHQLELNLGY